MLLVIFRANITKIAEINIVKQTIKLKRYTREHVGFPKAQVVKNLSTVQQTQVWPLSWEESPGEGNGNPLQYFCLENSMDRVAWRGYSPWSCKESDTTE